MENKTPIIRHYSSFARCHYVNRRLRIREEKWGMIHALELENDMEDGRERREKVTGRGIQQTDWKANKVIEQR